MGRVGHIERETANLNFAVGESVGVRRQGGSEVIRSGMATAPTTIRKAPCLIEDEFVRGIISCGHDNAHDIATL